MLPRFGHLAVKSKIGPKNQRTPPPHQADRESTTHFSLATIFGSGKKYRIKTPRPLLHLNHEDWSRQRRENAPRPAGAPYPRAMCFPAQIVPHRRVGGGIERRQAHPRLRIRSGWHRSGPFARRPRVRRAYGRQGSTCGPVDFRHDLLVLQPHVQTPALQCPPAQSRGGQAHSSHRLRVDQARQREPRHWVWALGRHRGSLQRPSGLGHAQEQLSFAQSHRLCPFEGDDRACQSRGPAVRPQARPDGWRTRGHGGA